MAVADVGYSQIEAAVLGVWFQLVPLSAFEMVVGSNETNATLNPTRHAEFLAIESLQKPGVIPAILKQSPPHPLFAQETGAEVAEKAFFQACDLFVTVEPCIMYVNSIYVDTFQRRFSQPCWACACDSVLTY